MRIGKHNFIRRGGKAFTLAEMIIAMTIMVIIMAAIMPQFRAIRNSWATSEASANITQNARVLQEHIVRNLSSAKQLISVSSSATTEGFITFKDADGNSKRYMFSGGYVVFGDLGSEEQLAGLVSRFQVSCYSLDDLDTPITDANNIRLVEVETDFTNSNSLGTDRTFTTSAYLHTNANIGLVGCWKLDETSGLTAADSSGAGYNGTLTNMAGNEWVTIGLIGGALAFDGNEDYVLLPDIDSTIVDEVTVSAWIYPLNAEGDYQGIAGTSSGQGIMTFVKSNNFYFDITNLSETRVILGKGTINNNQWQMITGTYDGSTMTWYINGENVGTSTGVSGEIHDHSSARIGYSGDSSEYFEGKIDSVRIYNYAMSAADVAKLANVLRYRDCNEAKVASD